jgi:hypothetical protein
MSEEEIRGVLLNCFRRQARLAYVTQDPQQRLVQQIRLEGMRAMALAAGLTIMDLDIISSEMAAASLGQKV